MEKYEPKKLEPKWQKTWDDTKLYQAEEDSSKPKHYQLEFFPYPSGVSMHVGHVRNYVISDCFARYKRMTGHNVLHPMGWDAFGLPAENQAIKEGIAPQESLAANIKTFKRQLQQMGISYDWSREINSSQADYYRWTQDIFLLFYEKDLAYKKEVLVNWCPKDKTVLANEQVIKKDGQNVCERCDTPVEKKELSQWLFKITDYADRLLEGLDDIDWPEKIKAMQRNWIGRSVGASINFAVDGVTEEINVFTTRPDTIFGATYMVLAPEHPLVGKIASKDQQAAINKYKADVVGKSEIERMGTDREKTGVFTGAYAINPATQKKMPIWVADYVLAGYGTGAIMAVPAHDQRDYEFASKFDLPIITVIEPETGLPQKDPVFRRSIVAIVRDPKTSKFLSINWGNANGGNLFVGGGVEEGEDLIEAAKREIAEETGYKNVKFIQQSGNIHHSYYAFAKKIPRKILATGLLFELENDERVAQQLEENEKDRFTVEWVDDAQASAIKDPLHRRVYGSLVANEVYAGEGIMVNSGPYDGMSSSLARERMLGVAEVSIDGSRSLEFGKPHPEAEQRHTVSAVVTRPQDDKILMVRWKEFGWWAPVVGGINEGETPEQAAAREVLEETGYTARPVKKLGPTDTMHFFAGNKNIWRKRIDQVVHLELVNDTKVAIEGEDQDKFEIHWLIPAEAMKRMTHVHNNIGIARHLGHKTMRLSGDDLPASLMDLPVYGIEKVNYKMRDWLISRQRYWGAPIPILYCKDCGVVPVPKAQLPVELPRLKTYQPSDDGRSPLARVEDWVETTCPACDGMATRETDTMDTFVDSSWYFLRFADPQNDKQAFSRDKVDYWLPVDNYVGGAEHAVAHLLFARFWTKVLYDAGLLGFEEPFKALRNQGMIGGPDGRKMGKRYGNVVTPDGLIDQGYGADALRLYELFIGPYDQGVDWNENGIDGTKRFLNRVWALTQEYLQAESIGTSASSLLETALASATHRALKKVTVDIQDFGFNTAVAAQMELVNEMYKLKTDLPLSSPAWKDNLETLLLMLAPFAPHMAEELWQQMGCKESVHVASWPAWDEKLLTRELVTIAIQINGKLRGTIEVEVGLTNDALIKAAAEVETVSRHLKDVKVIKQIVVPDKLVNFVVK